MKNLKMLYIALIALVASTFGACTNEFEPGPQMPGPQVSFLSSNLSKVELTGAANEDTQKLALTRIEKEEELTVDLLIEIDSKYSTIFSIPETVTFAAGEATTELVYTINQSRLEEGKIYTVNFLIADEMMSTPYGYTEWKVDYEMSPWELMTDANGNNAKGKFRGLPVMDNQLSGLDFAVEVDVDIYKHKKESKYRIKEPWAMSIVALFESLGVTVTVDQVKASFDYTAQDVIIDVSDPTNVTVPLQAMGLNDVNYFWSSNVSLGDFFYQGYGGTLEDGVITFPVGSFFCNCGYYRENGIPDDDPDYCAGANGTGLFRVILPGYEAADYSLAVEYNGMDVTADDVASAKIKFTYGNDVTGIKYMIVKGNIENNPTEALATLFAGTDENILTVEDFVKGGKTADLLVALESDSPYTILAAPVNKKDQLYEKGAFVKSFYFRGIGAVEEHPCEVKVLVAKLSNMEEIFGSDIVSANPDYSAFAYCILGKELNSCKFLVARTVDVNNALAEGATLEQVIAASGTDIPTNYLEYVNSDSGMASYESKLDSQTEYIVAAYAVNNYGEKAIASATYTTDAVPYEGSLVLGLYNMSCTMGAGTENETTFKNTFHISNIPGYTNDLLVKYFAIEDSLQWYATYDETASTITLSGLTVGNETLGSLFGRAYSYYDNAGSYVYGIKSFATEEATTGKDPVVLKVDPTTKQICGLPTGSSVWVAVLSASTGEWVFSHTAFDDTTVITPYSAPQNGAQGDDSSASTASVMSVGTPSVYTLARNIEKTSMTKIISKKSSNIQLASNANWTKISAQRTVKTVKPLLVESYTPEKSTSFKLKTNIKAFTR